MNRYYKCKYLTDKNYAYACSKKCKAIFFYKDLRSSIEVRKIELINVNDERAAFEYHYIAIKSKIEKAGRHMPGFFSYNDISLSEAFAKDLLWSTWIKGAFDFAMNKYVKEGDIVHDSSKNILSPGRALLKTFQVYSKGLSKSSEQQGLDITDKKYGFYITSSFHLYYYKNLINILGPENCVYLINHSSFIEEGLENKTELKCISKTPLLPRLKISLKEMLHGVKIFGAEDFSILLTLKQKFAEYIHINHFNFNSTLKVFFLAAQESSGFGNITALMGKKYNKLIINSHNGIKAGDVYNRDNHFDIWCVWDEKMKSILQKQCFINETQLKIVGHLMHDHALNYKPAEFFNDFIKNNAGKKIISLFSIPRDLDFKKEVVDLLVKFITENNLCLMVRLHPSESQFEWEKVAQAEPARIKIVIPNKSAFKEELYDQLYISSLSIVFASTVALESTWFGVPAITYELTEKSLLYNADNKKIFHVRNLSELEITMKNLLENPPKIEVEKTMAAQKIANLVWEWEKKASSYL